MSTTSEKVHALQEYIEALDHRDKEKYLSTTVDDVLLASQDLLAKRTTSSRTVLFCTKLEPIVQFLQKYAKAVDVMVQQSNPVALAWGCIRFLIEAVGSCTSSVAYLTSTLQEVGDKLRVCRQFDDIYSDWPPFRQSLTEVYYHILVLLFKIHDVLKSRTFRLLRKILMAPFHNEFQNSLLAIARHTALLEGETRFAHHRIAHLERRKQLMEWLSPVDSTQDLLRAKNKMTQGTCQWILGHSSYLTWKDWQSNDPVLWLSGRPGSGKTILSASIVEELQRNQLTSEEACVAYFFFCSNDSRKSNLLEASATIISQLIAHRSQLSASLVAAFESAIRYGRCRLSYSDKPMQILADLFQDRRKTYLVLDGIDESTETEDLLKQFLALGGLQNLRILCASRDTPETRTQLSKHPTLKLTPTSIGSDVDLYLRTELEQISDSFGQDDLLDLVFQQLSSAAAGSFLWVYLMLQTLRKASNPLDLFAMTTKLPRDLEAIYESALQSLDREPNPIKHLAKDLLCWVCFSRRPLRWKELEHALSFDSNCKENRAQRKPFKSAVLRLCDPFVEYEPLTDEFRPIHWSVCEFLARGDDLGFLSHHRLPPNRIAQNAHSLLVRVCVQELNNEAVANTLHIDADHAPLGGYATLNWCYHLFHGSETQDIRHEVEDFVSLACRRKTWIARYIFLQITAFPLQVILKQLREVHAWIIKRGIEPTIACFDVLQDMLDTIHLLSTQWSQSQIPSASTYRLGHFEKMMVVRDLARAYMLASRVPDAISWLTKALQVVEEGRGEAGIKSVWILNSLGIMYDQQNRFSMAADTQMRALDIQQRVLESNHLDIVWTKNELGRVYRHLSFFSEAEKMHLEALTTLEKTCPGSDPQVVWTKNTLARTYRFQGRFSEALALHEHALATQISTIGPDHAHTLWTQSDIARCLRDDGKLMDAYRLLLKVVEGRSKTLGELHADTLWSLNDIGLILSRLGREEEAREYHEKALYGQIHRLGKDHEHTRWTENHLADRLQYPPPAT